MEELNDGFIGPTSSRVHFRVRMEMNVIPCIRIVVTRHSQSVSQT
jgi:hypothetical protein